MARSGYPIVLDLAGRLVLLVGGGAVAVRKARGLVEAGADRIRCVAPEISSNMEPRVEKVCRTFVPADLEGVLLAFAATDSAEINATVVQECRRRGIWVNRADQGAAVCADEAGDFLTPAHGRRGPMLLAVSAAGAPALARDVRNRLLPQIDESTIRLADALTELRPALRAAPGLSDAARQAISRELASPAMALLLATHGREALDAWMQEQIDRAS